LIAFFSIRDSPVKIESQSAIMRIHEGTTKANLLRKAPARQTTLASATASFSEDTTYTAVFNLLGCFERRLNHVQYRMLSSKVRQAGVKIAFYGDSL
jgi:hypothetical protein